MTEHTHTTNVVQNDEGDNGIYLPDDWPAGAEVRYRTYGRSS